MIKSPFPANTDVVVQPDGWTRLTHQQEGLSVEAKTYQVEGKAVTVRLDSWSDERLSVHSYDLQDKELDEMWNELSDDSFFKSTTLSTEGLELPKDVLNDVDTKIKALQS